MSDALWIIAAVGTNRRYPYLAGKRREELELRAARAAGHLHSLTPEQLRLNTQPMTVVPDQLTKWGLAWLRFGDVDVRAVVKVKRWTADCVGVEVKVDDETLRCWIWQGACQAIDDPTEAW